MAKSNDKVTIAILGERLAYLQKDIEEIKNMISTIKGCAETAEQKAANLEGQFTSHIENHKSDLVKLGLFISVIVVVINIALRFI